MVATLFMIHRCLTPSSMSSRCDWHKIWSRFFRLYQIVEDTLWRPPWLNCRVISWVFRRDEESKQSELVLITVSRSQNHRNDTVAAPCVVLVSALKCVSSLCWKLCSNGLLSLCKLIGPILSGHSIRITLIFGNAGAQSLSPQMNVNKWNAASTPMLL